MSRSTRPGLALLLLAAFVAGAALGARADVVTYNVTLNWPSYVTPPTTHGFFVLDTALPNFHVLDDWSINTPQLGLFSKGPGQAGMVLVPSECAGNTCFEVLLQKPWNGGPFNSTLTLFFAGSVYTFHGGSIQPSITTPNGNLIFSRIVCYDPCNDRITGFADPQSTPIPEPSSLLLLSAGALVGRFMGRKRTE